MRQASSHAEAYGRSFQPDPIDCGENIKLYRQYMSSNPSLRQCLRDDSR